MAEAAGFEVTSSLPTSLTVVGRGNLKTKYGNYRFNLGPGINREFYEISCVGMNSVMSQFNKYDLSDICSEYTSLSDPNQPVPPLPKICGGFRSPLTVRDKKYNPRSYLD